jgi:hypothetical protein
MATAAKKTTAAKAAVVASPAPAPATAAYLVGDCPLAHDGAVFSPGAEVDLTDDQAARLGKLVLAVPLAAA